MLSSSYVRAVAVLSTGQLISAALPLLAAPVLGRLYLPADYGALATYMAVANVLGAISTLQLAQGIIAETSDRKAVGLVHACCWAAALVGLVAAAVAIALFATVGAKPGYLDVRYWLLLLPASTMAAGAVAAIAALANRHRRYGAMARIQIYVVVVSVAVSIALGLAQWGAHGLLVSYFVGQIITVGAHVWLYRAIVAEPPHYDASQLLDLARVHRKFPLYTLPSELLGTMNLQMPVLALTAVGATPLLGAFARARQLVATPLALMGSSIAQVFRQRASQQFRETGSCAGIYARTFAALALAGLPPTIILMLAAPDLFRIVLGPNWTEAGEISRVLAPMLYLGFICSPLSSVFYFTDAQHEDFALSIAAFALVLGSALLAALVIGQSIAIIYGYAISYAIIYVVYLIRGWQLARGRTVEASAHEHQTSAGV